jgi:Fe-S cluster assembly protein SufD
MQVSDLLDRLLTSTPNCSVRQQAADWAREIGLPTRKTERWKYTSLRSLEKKVFSQEAFSEQSESNDLNLSYDLRLSFVNDVLSHDKLPKGVTIERFTLEQEAADQYKDDSDVFACLNVAESDQAWKVTVSSDQTIMLSSNTTEDYAGAVHPCIFFDIQPGVSCTLYDIQYDEGAGLVNYLQNIVVGYRAQFNHIIHKDNYKSTVIQRCDVVVHDGATYNCYALDAGGTLNKQDINVRLIEQHASCAIYGVGVMGQGDHSDWRTHISHEHPHTNSTETFRILADHTGTGCFNGKIHIFRGADDSHSELSTGNLLVGNNARVNIKPELEIYAEEVTASHGATIGQLDDESLFYLQSRGLPEDEAISLLKYAFLAEPLEQIKNDEARKILLESLQEECSLLRT